MIDLVRERKIITILTGKGGMFKLIPLILLASCHSPSDLSGKWSGKVGPYKSALSFNNGIGKFCYSGNRKYKLEWARYHAGVIHTESGRDMVINSVSDELLVVEVDQQGVEEYTFKRNDTLKNAGWYCKTKLKGK